jgi:3-hydroxybutyryl-CoA dehydratase
MDIKLGDTISTSRLVTDELIRKFAEVSGDFNPIHLDDDVAGKTSFGRRIAHGMLSGAFISALFATEFEDRTVIYLSQTLRFIAPVFIGDTVTATGTITNIRDDKPIVTLETVCANQSGTMVVTGEAVVMVLP